MFIVLLCVAAFLGMGYAAEHSSAGTTPETPEGAAHGTNAHAASAAHGMPAKAPDVFHVGGFPISSSMLLTWIVAAAIILFARLATRRIREVPEGAQNFWEWLVESLYDFLAGIVGAELVKKAFWFFATIFVLILFENWAGLIPGVGTLQVKTDEGWVPLLRGANADLNMTFAMSMVFFAMWIVWAFQANGAKGFFLHIFGPKGDMTGILKVLMIVIFFLVGIIEVITILFRPVTLSFRLFGNVFAGENMLEVMATLVQEPAWAKAVCSVLIPIPFYFLELLVGLVQALVFMLLTSVFTLLIVQHDEDHGTKEAHP
jgi:F-type H+-transporting ATPase subunit a